MTEFIPDTTQKITVFSAKDDGPMIYSTDRGVSMTFDSFTCMVYSGIIIPYNISMIKWQQEDRRLYVITPNTAGTLDATTKTIYSTLCPTFANDWQTKTFWALHHNSTNAVIGIMDDVPFQEWLRSPAFHR